MQCKPIKVLHLISKLSVGGAENLLLSMAKHWDHERFSYQIVFLCSEGAQWNRLKELAIPATPIGFNGDFDLGKLIPCYKAIQSYQPDVIHTHLHASDLLGTFFSYTLKTPGILTTLHNSVPHYIGRSAVNLSPRRFLYRLLIRKSSNHFVACTKGIYQDFLQSRWQPKNLSFIENGIDCEVFHNLPESQKSILRQGLGVSKEIPVITMVGRLNSQKNPLNFLKALHLLDSQKVPFYGLVVGDGPLFSTMEEYIRQYGLSKKVNLIGIRKDVPLILSISKVFVISSDHEGLPLALIEAAATGIPIVATSVGGIPSFLESIQAGKIVEPGKPDQLAKAIQYVIDKYQDEFKLASSAIHRVRSDFDIRQTTRKYENLYCNLLKN